MNRRVTYILLVLLAVFSSCSKGAQTQDDDDTIKLSFSIDTKSLLDPTGQGSGIPGIMLDNDPTNENNYWGLNAFSSENINNTIIDNVKMNQKNEDGDPEPDYYHTEYRPSEGTSATSFKGGLVVSAYYPYRGTHVEPGNIKYYNPSFPDSPENHDEIDPVLTTNSLGHRAIHYGIPDFFRARKPTPLGVEPLDVEIDNNIRDVILYTHYKTYSVSELKTNPDIKIDIAPLTCLIAFKFSIAPRFADGGEPLPETKQPKSEDYEIVSVRCHRKGESRVGKDDPNYVDRATFNYDLQTGEITDCRYKSNGLYYEFPAIPATPEAPNPYSLTGIHPYDVHIDPVTKKVYDRDDEEMILSFVSFPEIYENLGEVEMVITYRYKLIGEESPEVDDDIWVTSSAVIDATSTYLQEGWKSGKVYYYHVYISRHEVRCDVEVIPWVENDLENDLFYGEVQV